MHKEYFPKFRLINNSLPQMKELALKLGNDLNEGLGTDQYKLSYVEGVHMLLLTSFPGYREGMLKFFILPGRSSPMTVAYGCAPDWSVEEKQVLKNYLL